MNKYLNAIKSRVFKKNSDKVSAAFGAHTDGSSFEGRNSVGKHSSVLDSDLGYASYVASGSFLRRTIVGKYCCIGKNVRVIDVTHPSRDYVSVHPLFFAKKTVVGESYVRKQKFDEYLTLPDNPSRSVRIGNDVWIGDGAMILGGHSIGDGAVIAAGAVVTKDIEPYTIAAGVPARPVRKRFSEEDIAFLQEVKWWDRGEPWIRENAELFDDIRKFRNQIEYNK